jgi:hypothetical protein
MLGAASAMAAKGDVNSVTVKLGLANKSCVGCHTNGYEAHWEKSGHVNYALAQDISAASFSGHEPDDENCLPCHTAQGYVEWAGRDFESYYDYKSSLVDPEFAHPQTCVTCHSPHDIGGVPDGAKSQLRAMGSTPMLPAGFKAEDIGKGALCITCHNSKYSAHNDMVTEKMNHRAPHAGAQADVLMGENLFFVETGNPGSHAMIEDTCVACHMPENEWKSGHSFSASVTSCNNCHDGMDGAALQAEIVDKTAQLKKAIDMALLGMLKAGLANGELGFLNMTEDEVEDREWTRLKMGTVKAVSIKYFHGRQAIDLTIDNTTYLAFINVIEIDGKNILDSDAGQVVARSGWNLILITHDHSGGMHNPMFVTEAIDASLAKLKAI